MASTNRQIEYDPFRTVLLYFKKAESILKPSKSTSGNGDIWEIFNQNENYQQ